MKNKLLNKLMCLHDAVIVVQAVQLFTVCYSDHSQIPSMGRQNDYLPPGQRQYLKYKSDVNGSSFVSRHTEVETQEINF